MQNCAAMTPLGGGSDVRMQPRAYSRTFGPVANTCTHARLLVSLVLGFIKAFRVVRYRGKSPVRRAACPPSRPWQGHLWPRLKHSAGCELPAGWQRPSRGRDPAGALAARPPRARSRRTPETRHAGPSAPSHYLHPWQACDKGRAGKPRPAGAAGRASLGPTSTRWPRAAAETSVSPR